MRHLLFTFSILLPCCLFTTPVIADERPNIVLILVDDLGYGDLACFGAEEMRTPHLDKLMASGMRFDNFYANCTVCSPTRASLMTGRYPDVSGVPGVIRQWDENSWGYLDPDAPTLPQLLRSSGYHTGMVGKWHLGFEPPNVPNHRGFDFFHGFLGDMMDDYYDHLRGGENWMRLNDETIEPKGHATDLFTQWSIDYVRQQATDDSKPFFLYLAYNAPHFPIQPPQDWLQKVREREPQLSDKRAKNVAFVEHLDDGIGRLISAIREIGIEKETLVIFSSDNGGSLPHAQSNGDLRGGKQDHWEGGIRVPTCAVWPGTIPAKRSSEPGMTMDFLPTLCEIAGASVTEPINGLSLTDIWLRNGKSDPDRTMIWVRREGNRRYQGRAYYAIRKGPWKLLQNTPFEPMVLVNLEQDPFEEAPKPPQGKIADELRSELMLHLQAAGSVAWQP
ncbi:MAG: sulfatase-like hydrolase/transferase [Planctomycetota bacterium]